MIGLTRKWLLDLRVEMKKIYVVQTWEHDTYNFWVISRNTEIYFSTKEKAMDWIQRNNFKVVVYIKNPETDVTLYEEIVDDFK